MIGQWLKRGWMTGIGDGVLGDGTYDSSIDAIAALPYRYCHPSGASDIPIAIVMHGFGGDYGAISDSILASVAQYNLFAVAVGMRGRSGRTGPVDCSGREIHDIYDALVAIRTAHAAVVDPTDAAIIGYSGGGGNALAAACKFPDSWLAVVDNFGMSDYGRDGTDSWYYDGTGTGYQSTMALWIGGTPVAMPDAYYARDATAAILNYSGGKLFMFHDDADSSVDVKHSQRVAAILAGAGRTNYAYAETGAGDNPRWLHGYPEPGTELARSIDTWASHVRFRTTPAWTIPASGTITVIGYIVSKRFAIWLGTGVNEVATVAYDTATDSYTVTPLTGSMAVSITQGSKSGGATISGATTIVVA